MSSVIEQHDTAIIEMRNPVMCVLNDRFVAVPAIDEQVVDRICPTGGRVVRRCNDGLHAVL